MSFWSSFGISLLHIIQAKQKYQNNSNHRHIKGDQQANGGKIDRNLALRGISTTINNKKKDYMGKRL